MSWNDIKKKSKICGGVHRVRLTVRGRVQGVGFRPSVYRFAKDEGLTGSVKNTNSGVIIEIEGDSASIDAFGASLMENPPPMARLDSVDIETFDLAGYEDFVILESDDAGDSDTIFPVDTAVCGDCLAEMRDPSDPRYLYPFINCTNCGPRFTIIEGLPYDRHLTTMSEFKMDSSCSNEYSDPLDRRFHAEPISCPGCGPTLELIDYKQKRISGDPIDGARKIILDGQILAVKGLGGYHLACLATDAKVVELLRSRKRRPAKPFALMFSGLDTVKDYCLAGEEEIRLLESPEAPIVLLRKRENALPDLIAPGNGYFGAFLPYTPVHHLLIEGFELLIMTSANFSDEPLISTEKELKSILGPIADAALTNNRNIAHKCDDSIFFVPSKIPVPLRRARGFVPEPVKLPQFVSRSILGTGGQEKGTFTLTRGDMAYVSPHLGDLGDLRGQTNYRLEYESFKELLGVEPEIAVCDMHPDYFTTRFADELGCLTVVRVQHHHAHAVSVMVEHGIEDPVIGVSFDGTGYGTDGRLWGGEFLLATYHDFTRLAHLKYIPLPGGSVAIREPWRMTLMYLWQIYGDAVLEKSESILPLDIPLSEKILQLARQGINSIETSSIGRLFDAVASILGCRQKVSYEAEAAIMLEELALRAVGTERYYDFYISDGDPAEIDPSPVIKGVVDDLLSGKSREEIAAVFHNSVAHLVVSLSYALCRKAQCGKVVLSGGVFQNRYLCEKVSSLSSSVPPIFYQHRIVPPNDGGISLGQVQAGVSKMIKGLL